MAKNKKISPSELNRFTYCPYQWYYERVYGRRKLTELFREKHGYSHGKGNSPMAFGNKFHKNYFFIYRMKLFFRVVIVIAIIFFIAFLIGDLR